MQVLLQHAGGELHRHVVAGKGHHGGAARDAAHEAACVFQAVSVSRSRITGPSGSRGKFLETVEAPSVPVPEIVIPSAGAFWKAHRVSPES